ncbi:hypothetical protein TRAPUB_6321 [Trametes pubescens]|uniref:RING-type domain-containing protein n=1 Tax=Trametes pubescens TaxID=154538 RepID=A0A1M2W6T1_TRAPU|nr:hypothetical protein TRAPUB_6321 [Trametes pubescens]
MGQANSRRTGAPPSVSLPQPATPSSSSDYDSSQATLRDGPGFSTPSASPSTKTLNRSSLRRGVRSFLRPRTQSDSTSPSSSHQIPSLRKRWRSSRRFSKAQASLPNLSEALHDSDRPPAAPAVGAQLLAVEEQPVQIEPSSSTPFPSVLPATSRPVVSLPSRSYFVPPSESHAETTSVDEHGVIQEHVTRTVAEQPSRSTLSTNKHDASPQFQEHPERAQEIEREINDFLLERPRQDSLFVEGSSQDGQISDAPEPSPPYASSALPEADGATEAAMAQAPRHFPPPGTLVVVQGVVNTSDNPASTQPSQPSRSSRPASAVNPAPPPAVPARRSSSVPRVGGQQEERQTARSRLSAFLPRTASMRRRRSSTSDPSVVAPLHSQSTSDVSSSAFESSASDDYLADASDPLSSSAVEPGAGEDNGDPRSRPLSPGSIDVLGTLLSVAAAATAASLFSPSLGFQANADPNAPAQPGSAIPRPMSPTPTAGLGGGPAFGLDIGADTSTPPPPTFTSAPQQREGRERIRNVWESFRERLGLNRGTAAQAASGASANAEEPGNMRPGEIMLAEMARALNVGLGLTGDGSSAGATTTEPPAEPAEATQGDGATPAETVPTVRPPPPEDSFERFLLDLQADLRVALSQSSTGDAAAAPATEGQDVNAGNDEAPASEAASDSPELSHDEARAQSPSAATVDDDADNEDELPPLDDVSDSEVEDYDVEDEHTSSTRIATPMPASRDLPNRSDQASPASNGRADAQTPVDARGEAERRPPGIHLWRLYRFRPIHATQIAGHAASTTPPTAPVFPQPTASPPSVQAEGPSPSLAASASFSPSPPSPATATSGSRDGADSPSPAPPATDPNANMVVPVIVVGLQSVEMGQVHGHAHPAPNPGRGRQHPHAHTHAQEHEGSPPSPDADDWMQQGADEQAGDATPRGRSWQSRAATALRNLRPGRRTAQGGQQTAGTGSRTFLIYVIGGYYPPNHHMVTGPDNLDSYEALWELAELLGQVKPQVATREDIDKSDLQIVKYSELEKYEREGRVSSNCVERCLICLDDYQPEDDVRLMHCRHAFHQECVDKWMQVGRNNCPACRTKGVSTADELVP